MTDVTPIPDATTEGSPVPTETATTVEAPVATTPEVGIEIVPAAVEAPAETPGVSDAPASAGDAAVDPVAPPVAAETVPPASPDPTVDAPVDGPPAPMDLPTPRDPAHLEALAQAMVRNGFARDLRIAGELTLCVVREFAGHLPGSVVKFAEEEAPHAARLVLLGVARHLPLP